MDINSPEFEYFLDLSVVLTGFPKFNLHGTGCATVYFETIRDIVGEDRFARLLNTFNSLQMEKDESIFTDKLRREILGSEEYGPIARNIIRIWYVATWEQLPKFWRERFGTKPNDQTFIISPQAYPEGLLWATLGVNPPGAKGQGYGTWSEPPSILNPA